MDEERDDLDDGRLGIETPMSFTRFVSSIYRMAPDNPFDLPLPFFRRFTMPEHRPRAPVTSLRGLAPELAESLRRLYSAEPA